MVCAELLLVPAEVLLPRVVPVGRVVDAAAGGPAVRVAAGAVVVVAVVVVVVGVGRVLVGFGLVTAPVARVLVVFGGVFVGGAVFGGAVLAAVLGVVLDVAVVAGAAVEALVGEALVDEALVAFAPSGRGLAGVPVSRTTVRPVPSTAMPSDSAESMPVAARGASVVPMAGVVGESAGPADPRVGASDSMRRPGPRPRTVDGPPAPVDASSGRATTGPAGAAA